MDEFNPFSNRKWDKISHRTRGPGRRPSPVSRLIAWLIILVIIAALAREFGWFVLE